MAWGTVKHRVMFTGIPSSASARVAARPSTIVGIFTTTLGAIFASSRPSRTISSRVMATDSADTGQSGPTMSQMRLMWLWKSSSLPPMREYSVGLVVTPASAPQLAASSISARSAVSRKNFTFILLLEVYRHVGIGIRTEGGTHRKAQSARTLR